MKNYKGYYVDKVVFNNEAEIDIFLEQQAITKFQASVKYFSDRPSLEASTVVSNLADVLNKRFGYSWTKIEQLELGALA